MSLVALQLKADVVLTAGSGGAPIDLLAKSTGMRFPLTEEESAIAALLTTGLAEGKAGLAMLQRERIDWDLNQYENFILKLEQCGFIERQYVLKSEHSEEIELADDAIEPMEDTGEEETAIDVLIPLFPQNTTADAATHDGITARYALNPPAQISDASAVEFAAAQKPKSSVRWFVIAGIAIVAIASGVAAGVLVKVPDDRIVDCHAETIVRATISADLTGTLRTLNIGPNQRVAKGSIVAEIVDDVTIDKIAALTESIESDAELLAIMKTGGSDASDRKQSAIVQQATDALNALPTPCDDDCEKKQEKFKTTIARAKEKLHFAEWQAADSDKEQVQARIADQQNKLAELKKQQTHSQIKSTESGWITEAVQRNGTVKSGDKLATVVDDKKFLVTLKSSPVPVGSIKSAMVELIGNNVTAAFTATVKSNASGTPSSAAPIELLVPADIQATKLAAVCRAKLNIGTVSWLSSRLSSKPK